MTVREMEEVTGLTRANIRFYETQGLIVTERRENNYREYTHEHAEILLRIKLLRALGMSLEQIRALQTGTEHLLPALERQIEILSRQQIELGNSQRVCREMREDNVRYETLDARRYLSSLENPPKQPSVIVQEDVEPEIFAPWQRYWARALDSFVYASLITAVATWLLDGAIPAWGNLVSTVLGICVMLILEPVQLRLFGTTLGKWIFGITVTDMDGRYLSLQDGFWRTAIVLWSGQGLNIPIVNWWRLYKSYKMYEYNEFLPWDDPSELTVKDKNPWRFLAALGVAAVAFALMVGSMTLARLPEHQGELTVAQFCANYRKLEAQDGADDERFVLRDDGTWLKQEIAGTVYIDLSPNSRPLDFAFVTTPGADQVPCVEQVTVTETLNGPQEGMIGGHFYQMRCMALAFLMAQPDYNIFAGDEEEILTAISKRPFQSFCITSCGLEFRYDVTVTGYWVMSAGSLIEDDDPATDPHYTMTFTIRPAHSVR